MSAPTAPPAHIPEVHPERDGGPFSPAAECPKCGLVDLHLLRAPNPGQPQRLDKFRREMQIMSFSLGFGIANRDMGVNWGFDRWDERPFESIRTCIDGECGYEWGHR